MLTDEELNAVIDQQWGRGAMENQYAAHRAFARAVIAKSNGKVMRSLQPASLIAVTDSCDRANMAKPLTAHYSHDQILSLLQ